MVRKSRTAVVMLASGWPSLWRRQDFGCGVFVLGVVGVDVEWA